MVNPKGLDENEKEHLAKQLCLMGNLLLFCACAEVLGLVTVYFGIGRDEIGGRMI